MVPPPAERRGKGGMGDEAAAALVRASDDRLAWHPEEKEVEWEQGGRGRCQRGVVEAEEEGSRRRMRRRRRRRPWLLFLELPASLVLLLQLLQLWQLPAASSSDPYDPLTDSDRPMIFVDYLNGPLRGKEKGKIIYYCVSNSFRSAPFPSCCVCCCAGPGHIS